MHQKHCRIAELQNCAKPYIIQEMEAELLQNYQSASNQQPATTSNFHILDTQNIQGKRLHFYIQPLLFFFLSKLY